MNLGWTNKFVIIYVGAHGVANHLIQLIDAAKLLKDTIAHFVLIGDGMQKKYLINISKKDKISNVEFIDPVPKNKIMEYIMAADVGTSVLKKNDVFKTVYSNKTFDYMLCKKPILMAIDGVSRDLVQESKSGFFVKPESPNDFSSSVKKMLKNKQMTIQMGQNGYDYVVNNFDRKKISKGFIESLKTNF